MRTQLLFALAIMCGGAAAGAQEPAAKIPTYPGGEGVMPAVATDAASSFRHYAAASSKAADAASEDDNKAGSGLQLTAGVTGLIKQQAPRQIVAEPVMGAPVDSTPCGDGGVVPGGGFASSGGGSDALFWVTGSGMVGWTRAVRLPTPLVTSTTADPSQRLAGAIRLPGTTVLFGNKIDYDTSFGGQVEAGLFLDDSRFWSADVKGFYIAPDDVTFAAASDASGSPLLTRPFFSLAERREAALFTAKPGIASGSIDLKAENEFWGFEVNGRANFGNFGAQGVRGSVLTGFRYLRLRDKLTINDQLTPLAANQVSYQGGPVNPPSTISDQDSFETTNEFYGAQIGAQVSVEQSWLLLTAYAKLGFGVTQQKSDIAGSTTLTTPAGTDVTQGGVLALPSNIGSRTVDVFGLVPEWGLTLGASVTQNIRVTAGYSFLLWNRVVRTGDVIDRALNPALIPTDASFGALGGPDRPSPRFNNNDNVFWLHAATLGLEVLF